MIALQPIVDQLKPLRNLAHLIHRRCREGLAGVV